MTSEEVSLIAACKRREEQACKQLYDTYASKMFVLCLRYSNSRESAQDVLHDGFVKVFEKLGQLRPDGNLSAWIYSIMMRTAITRLRRESVRSTERLEDVDTSEMTASADFDRYDTEVLLKAIQRLPEGQRVVFNLCEIEGYTLEEVSAMTGIRLAGVRSSYYRARQHLAEMLKELIW